MRSAPLFTAGCVLGIEEADDRLVCAQNRIVQLESMLKAAREEVAACNQNKLQLEERKEMFEKQEEVYGRLQRGCRAAAARAEQAMQVHTRCATQGLSGVHHKWRCSSTLQQLHLWVSGHACHKRCWASVHTLSMQGDIPWQEPLRLHRICGLCCLWGGSRGGQEND